MHPSILTAWDTAWERYFCPETELFYEFTVDEEHNAWFHLPTPEEILRHVPNPCGWGTGMEDSVMTTGTVLDALVAAYDLCRDPALKVLGDRCLRGLMRCAGSKKNEGFISRSVSPFDPEVRYIESSRDQYTHWVYGALRWYDSPMCDQAQKAAIRDVLVKLAKKCERDVTPEHDYHLLREENSVGSVNQMWGDKLGTHEYLRLPMFYLAAWYVSGDGHWQEQYLRYRDQGIERSLPHDPTKMRCYGSLQMMCSLRALYDLDPDPAVREKVGGLMKRMAEFGAKKAVENAEIWSQPEKQADIHYRFRPWNQVEHLHIGTYGGYTYDNPAQSERKDNPAFYPIREVCEGATMAAMCPAFPMTEDVIAAVEKIASVIDFRRYSSVYMPLYVPCAYILCKERQALQGKS